MTSFMSYSGDVERVERLVRTLRRHGLRTWRYQDNLGQGAPTEADIETALARCSSAMIWLGGRTLHSAFVIEVELPRIFDNHRRRGTRIVPLFVDVDVETGSAQVRDAVGEEIASHNGYVWDPAQPEQKSLDAIAAADVAALLAERARTPGGRRPIVRMVTRSDGAGARDEADMNLDWIHEYPADGALPNSADRTALEAALHVACQSLIANFGGGTVDLHLKCHLHLGVALGFELRRTTGMVPRVELDGAWCTIGPPHSASGSSDLESHTSNGPAASGRVDVEVSITRDVGPLVNDFITQTATSYRRRVRLQPSGGPNQYAVTPSNIDGWSEQSAQAVRDVKSLPGVTDVDLFLAAPIGFAVGLGWRLNAIGGVHLFHPSGNAGPYVPVWDLPNS